MPELDPDIKLVEQFTMFTYDIWHYNIQCLSSLISAWLLVPNSIVSVAHKDNHMFIECNNMSVLSCLQQQQMVISCLILGKSLILQYTTINATIYLSIYRLFIYLPRPTYLPTYLQATYLPTYKLPIPTYLPTYLPILAPCRKFF